jgi:hypothetical protein
MPKLMFFDPSKVTKWSSSKTSTDASGAGGNMNGYAWYAGDMIKVPVPEQQGPQANINTGASTSSPVSSTQQAAADKQSVLASPGSYSCKNPRFWSLCLLLANAPPDAHSIMDEDEYATPRQFSRRRLSPRGHLLVRTVASYRLLSHPLTHYQPLKPTWALTSRTSLPFSTLALKFRASLLPLLLHTPRLRLSV